MRIKRLDITGFKSFMDRVVFQFDLGITGVVGPNGCGKSNVVDAIRWVMGEQSAKNLRGRGMEDVIFNGSELHAPLSMSEVTLTFKIDEGDVLPATLAGLTEVSVTRRMFRGSNESEYAINKVACRMLDITELFLGTGVGTRAYSIIEQGRVGQIVSARPEDRRAFIEEAAGVTKYKARRKAAERKMESTQGNLLRVNDIVQELERRLDSLERQAKKAEKYKKLKAEMRELELHVQSHRWLELTAQKKVLELQLSTLSNEERESYGRVQGLEAEIEQRRTTLDAEGQAIEHAAVELSALEGQEKLDAQNLGHWRTDAESTRARLAKAQADAQSLAARGAELKASLEQREAELSQLAVGSKEDEVALQVSEEETRRVSHLSIEVAARLERERNELVEVVTKVANHETHLTDLLSRRSELEQRRARHQGEIETLKAEEAQAEAARAEVLDRVGNSRQNAHELASRRTDEESQLTRTREEFAENEIQVICLREELADKRSRLNSLQEIARNYEGYDRGVRAVMLKAGGDPKAMGVFGVVSDVVTAPAQYEKAIEAALGERLQHIIVETPEKGFELVEHLRELSEGRSTFLPVIAAQAAAGFEGEPPPGARAIDVVTVTEEVLRPVVQLLLQDVMLVPELAIAREQAARFPAARDRRARAAGEAARGELQRDCHPALRAAEADGPPRRGAQGAGEEPARRRDQPRHPREGPDPGGPGAGEAARADRGGRPRGGAADRVDADLEHRGSAPPGGAAAAAGRDAGPRAGDRPRAGGPVPKVRVASASEKGEAAHRAVEQLQAQAAETQGRAEAIGKELEEGSGHLELLQMQIGETAERQAARAAQLAFARGDLEARRSGHNEAAAKVRE
ncbi:MAG: smc, partial [Myxococcaceae bacterium]|nr:smc [Myxococcaceae bacterium]